MNKPASSPPLQQYFTEVPPRYDRINRLMTWGLDQRYRRRMAKTIAGSKIRSFLDIGTGTGDLVYQIALNDTVNSIRLWGLDFSETMLEKAEKKCMPLPHSPVTFVHGDASEMPFDDESFEAAGIAYAFRNMMFMNTQTHQITGEYYRILKPGGIFYALETSQPAFPPLQWLFHTYMVLAAAFLGGLLSGNYKAYRYLAWSTNHFHDRKTIEKMLKEVGFIQVRHHPVLMGMMAITTATK